MRPEVIAFRELDTLVRNLSDQLAGYRRRALSAEARAKELQHEMDGFDTLLGDGRTEVELAHAARDVAIANATEVAARDMALKDAVQRMTLARDLAEAMLAERRAADVASAAAAAAIAKGEASPVETALLAENARLRARLAEARDRTAQMVERVRFLRQQMTAGAER